MTIVGYFAQASMWQTAWVRNQNVRINGNNLWYLFPNFDYKGPLDIVFCLLILLWLFVNIVNLFYVRVNFDDVVKTFMM